MLNMQLTNLKNIKQAFVSIEAISVVLLLTISSDIYSQDKFYNYYEQGTKYIEKRDWLRALDSFKSAASLEFQDAKRKRTYGTRFIKYFPHREMGIAYYNLGEFDDARRELELSIAYKRTKEAEKFLEKVNRNERPSIAKKESLKKEDSRSEEDAQKIKDREVKLARERKLLAEAKVEAQKREGELEKQKNIFEENKIRESELRTKELERKRNLEENKLKKEREAIAIASEDLRKREENLKSEKKKFEDARANRNSNGSASTLPVGALTYDPSKVTQVGSRLSVAVLPFSSKGVTENIGELITAKLITQLVNLRRFKVIERASMTEIMEEQKLGMAGVVDEQTAINVGKIAGADVIIVGNINVGAGFGTINARMIDTETSETIVAKEETSTKIDTQNLVKMVESIAIMIYNDLPIVEGYIIKLDRDLVYLDIGSDLGIRRGMKCVAFSEGESITHPITGEVLGVAVSKLGELLITQVQNRLSIAILTEGDLNKIKVSDKIVVK